MTNFKFKNLGRVLKHYFLPHRGNAFRPHAFRHKMLSWYSIGLILSQLAFGITTYAGPTISAQQSEVMKKNIVTLTNAERSGENLSDLKENIILTQAAYDKLNDMFAKNYWDHKGPNGETAWEFVEKEGYVYQLAGENLARGYDSSAEVVAAWMKSESHRANILNERFRDIGIAVGSGEINGAKTTLVVQIFGEPKTAFAAAATTGPGAFTPKEVLPEIDLGNPALPSKLPYFLIWSFIFGLILVDGFMIRKLGLHASRSHVFNLRVSLLLAGFGLVFMMIGFVGIA